MTITRSDLIKKFKKYTDDNHTPFLQVPNNCVRLMVFNVHMWKDVDNKYTTDEILDTIISSNSDIVGLCESLFYKQSKLRELVFAKLKSAGYTYIEQCNYAYGINMLISKYPIITKKIIKLEKDPINGENRYAITATIDLRKLHNSTKSFPINVILTHLDVWDETENTRMNQIFHIMSHIDSSYILMGDLNSLKKKDYLNSEWLDIVNDSAHRNVDAKHMVTDYMSRINFTDSFAIINKAPPKVSVWSMRRIDYIYTGIDFPYEIEDSNVYHTRCSDHYPIYVDVNID